MKPEDLNSQTALGQELPRIVSMTHIETKENPEWSFPLHVHEDDLEFSLILRGKGLLYYDKQSFHVQTGDLIIKQAGRLHAEKTVPTDPLAQICVTISLTDVSGYDFLLEQPALPILRTNSFFPLLREQILFLLEHYHDVTGENIELTRLVWSSTLCLMRLLLSKEPNRKGGKQDSSNINSVIEYIDKNFNKNLSLQSLSEKFYISPWALAKQFKKVTDYSVCQYIINRRMGEAERMLLFENKSIKEVSLKCGFNDITYFYRTFKKYTGCTPSDFRKVVHHKSNGKSI